jgi:hypothetical protein
MLVSSRAGRRAWGLVGGQSRLRETLERVEAALGAMGIPHVYVGSVALLAHGVCQVTDDIDVCVRPADRPRLNACLDPLLTPDGRRLRDPRTGTILRAIPPGTLARVAGAGCVAQVPDPVEAVCIDEVPVPSLPRLLELKLATGRYRDWGDVVELIRTHDLGEDFADQLDSTLRAAYLQCWDQKVEEDRYNPEVHDPPPDPPRARRTGE